MRLVVISGLSGAGKSVALHTLEDLGFYCTDNLPANLLPAFVEQLLDAGPSLYQRAAVGIDARNPTALLGRFPEFFSGLAEQGVRAELIFLEAEDPILIKRFSETRRRHPLSGRDLPLQEAIREERKLLAAFSDQASLRIDTSHTHLHQLRDVIRDRVGLRPSGHLSLLIQSFGFKQGVPRDADFVFDLRCLPNPHWDPSLRPFTGKDPAVAEFLEAEGLVRAMFDSLVGFFEQWIPRFREDNRAYLTVALGCTGGQHRSVYLAERLGAHFGQSREYAVTVRHRELD